MFSKAGKATNEVFFALRHGQELLEPGSHSVKGSSSLQRSVSKVDKLSDLASKRFQKNGIMKDLIGILDIEDSPTKQNMTSKSAPKSTKDLKKFEPFAQVVSRERREKVLSHKTVSSNAAYYAPKYEHVEKKNPILVDYSKSSTKRLFDDLVSSTQPKSADQANSSFLPPISDKPKEKVKGIIPLDLQVPRPDVFEEIKKKKVCLTDALADPGLPSALGIVPRLPRIKFSRAMSRKDMVIETAGTGCPLYNPNFEVVKKSLGKVGAQIDKVTGRKDQVRVPYYTNETVYDYDDYVKNNKSHVYPKAVAPSFNKMPPREKYPESKYPAYLQSMNSKISEPVLTKGDYSERNRSRNYASPQSFETSLFHV